MKKILVLFLSAAILTTLVVVSAYAFEPPDVTKDTPSLNSPEINMSSVNLGEASSNSLVGRNGSVLLVDSISDSEYSEMMGILYPNGLIDVQGLDIPWIDNLEEAREKFIFEHTKAYSFDGQTVTEIALAPFTIELSSLSNETYTWQFYQAQIGDDHFVFPSEWGKQPCGFEAVSKADIYLAYTDIGIWNINPITLTADKITADTYTNTTAETKNSFDKELFWIDSLRISPNGTYAVYRTSRDCTDSSGTSVWVINLQSGEERQVIEPSRTNDIVGFLSETHIVVGAFSETKMTDISTGEELLLTFPELPNFSVCGVNNGTIVYSSYAEGSSDTTAFIADIDLKTGGQAPIASVKGYLECNPQFSSSGEILAIGYGSDPMLGVDDAVLVSLADGSQKRLSSSLSMLKRNGFGRIRGVQWVGDNNFIITSQSGSEMHDYLIVSQG